MRSIFTHAFLLFIPSCFQLSAPRWLISTLIWSGVNLMLMFARAGMTRCCCQPSTPLHMVNGHVCVSNLALSPGFLVSHYIHCVITCVIVEVKCVWCRSSRIYVSGRPEMSHYKIRLEKFPELFPDKHRLRQYITTVYTIVYCICFGSLFTKGHSWMSVSQIGLQQL